MRRGTTPYITIKVKGTEFKNSKVRVVIKQDELVICKSAGDLQIKPEPETNSARVVFRLSQEETLQFKPGKANVQIMWIRLDGNVFASKIATLRVSEILGREVLRYE